MLYLAANSAALDQANGSIGVVGGAAGQCLSNVHAPTLEASKRFGNRKGSWLAKMLKRKPKMLVAITLANRKAGGIWAMLTKQENYRDPEVMA